MTASLAKAERQKPPSGGGLEAEAAYDASKPLLLDPYQLSDLADAKWQSYLPTGGTSLIPLPITIHSDALTRLPRSSVAHLPV